MLPSQQEILYPLLKTLEDAGGEAKPQAVYDDLARRVGLREEDRTAVVPNGVEGRPVNAWERRVRNARQKAVAQGLIEGGEGRRFESLDVDGNGHARPEQRAPRSRASSCTRPRSEGAYLPRLRRR
jgi:hypothetical protein